MFLKFSECLEILNLNQWKEQRQNGSTIDGEMGVGGLSTVGAVQILLLTFEEPTSLSLGHRSHTAFQRKGYKHGKHDSPPLRERDAQLKLGSSKLGESLPPPLVSWRTQMIWRNTWALWLYHTQWQHRSREPTALVLSASPAPQYLQDQRQCPHTPMAYFSLNKRRILAGYTSAPSRDA